MSNVEPSMPAPNQTDEENQFSPPDPVSRPPVERGNRYVDHPSEAIWSVYLSEAKRHDDALVDGWQSDMTGILIFAGLFSAVVTAFIIESYKTLKQDTGDVTVALLARISEQLANGTNANIPLSMSNPTSFDAASSALRVNALWFLSLSFSLACALVATLVQQWSRNYLIAIQRRPALYKRARTRSFLYEGLKKFGMPGLVNIIPTLLHISLFLFWSGLFEFLRPINPTITYLTLGILSVCVILYLGTAIFSAIYQNCPYQIPISAIFWHILSLFRRLYHNYICRFQAHRPLLNFVLSLWFRRRMTPTPLPSDQDNNYPKNMREEMESLALTNSYMQDLRALRWTLECLTDNAELEPFVEGIPGFLISRDIPPEVAILILNKLFEDKTNALDARIIELFKSCDDTLGKTQRQKRAVACLKAILTRVWLSTYSNLPISNDLVNFETLCLVRSFSSPADAHLARYVCAVLSCILLQRYGLQEQEQTQRLQRAFEEAVSIRDMAERPSMQQFLHGDANETLIEKLARLNEEMTQLERLGIQMQELLQVPLELLKSLAPQLPLDSLNLPLEQASEALKPADAHLLACVCLLAAFSELPYDLIVIPDHPDDKQMGRHYSQFLGQVIGEPTVAGVRPQIQQGLVGAVNEVLKCRYGLQFAYQTFQPLLPLLRRLEDPTSVRDAIALIEDFLSKASNKAQSLQLSTLEQLRAELNGKL